MKPSITDWLMVVITLVYVVATIFICLANRTAAKASLRQIEESSQQFEETRRLEIMPYLQLDADNTSSFKYKTNPFKSLSLAVSSNDSNGKAYTFNACLRNIGHGTAKHITYAWKNIDGYYERGIFSINALPVKDEAYFEIEFIMPSTYQDSIKASIVLTFDDLLEHQYTQSIDFVFKNNNGYSIIHTMNPPALKETRPSNV